MTWHQNGPRLSPPVSRHVPGWVTRVVTLSRDVTPCHPCVCNPEFTASHRRLTSATSSPPITSWRLAVPTPFYEEYDRLFNYSFQLLFAHLLAVLYGLSFMYEKDCFMQIVKVRVKMRVVLECKYRSSERKHILWDG